MTTPELAHIRDIIPPAAVTSEPTGLVYLIMITTTVALISLYLYFRSSASRLHHLRRQHQQGRKNNRQIAQQLRRLLCEQLGLVQFSPYKPPSETTAEGWYRFAMELEASCFGKVEPGDESLNMMFNEARNWLGKRS